MNQVAREAATSAVAAGVRLDVWLWAARFFKTRALAKQGADGGRIEVNGASGKPSRALRVGDCLRITRGEEHFEIELLALSDRRGPASVAQTLYRETAQSLAARQAIAEQKRMQGAAPAHPGKRPDKRARRLILALGDLDMS